MDSHETDIPVWSRLHHGDHSDAAPDDAEEIPSDVGDSDAMLVSVPEEDVVVIESYDVSEDRTPDVPVAAAAEPAAPEPAAPEPAAPESAGPATGDAEQWSEIKAMFVDDPGGSVSLASGLVEHAIENLMTSLRQRQESLASWEAGDANGTEELRNALRGYRNLFEELDGMSGQFRSGPERVRDT